MKYITVKLTEDQARAVQNVIGFELASPHGWYKERPEELAFLKRIEVKLAKAKIS